MEHLTVGAGPRVSRLAFGCEALGGTDWGVVDEAEATLAVRVALERGVNMFDTADVYGLGRSEERLAAALGTRRKDVVISTKFGLRWEVSTNGGRARTFRDSSPRHVTEAVEGSLRRLRLDCIPLYQVHWPDPGTPIAATMEALRRCREAGDIQHVGVSNFTAKQIREAHALLPLAVAQVSFNLIDRRATQELLCCAELGIGVVAYGSLAQGLLTGKYGPGSRFESNDRRGRLQHFTPRELSRHQRTVALLREVAARYGSTPSQVAIRWLLEHPCVAVAIVGAKTPNQVNENVGSMGWSLTRADWDLLASQCDHVGVAQRRDAEESGGASRHRGLS